MICSSVAARGGRPRGALERLRLLAQDLEAHLFHARRPEAGAQPAPAGAALMVALIAGAGHRQNP